MGRNRWHKSFDTGRNRRNLSYVTKEIELPEEFDKANYMEDGEFDEGAWLDAISDWLSEDYGFCHYGFKISKKEKDQEIQKERE